MSYFLTIKRLWRPDLPQPVYKGALNLWEAPLYPPIGAETRNASATPKRVSDTTFLFQDVPLFGWFPLAAAPVTPTWVGPIDLASYRSGDRSSLDVRAVSTPSDAWLFTAADAVTRTWAPVFLAETGYRTPDRARLEARHVIATNDGWAWTVVDAIVRTWAPAFQAKYPAPPGPNPWRYPPDNNYGWLTVNVPAVVVATVAQTLPAFLVQSYRQADRRDRLNVSTVPEPEPAWWRGAFAPASFHSITLPNMSRQRGIADGLREIQLSIDRYKNEGGL